MVLFAVFGARIWHVVTDWQLYKNEPHLSFYIWNGGISILGAILGGAVGGYVAANIFQFSDPKKSVVTLFDLSIFGLPIAQAIGRFGNFVNQELYGLPTNLPWGITIDAANRVAGFEQFSTFHPLFAYEAVLTAGFGCVVWFFFLKKKKYSWLELGQGKLVLSYVAYYSFVRFLLEFLRIEKSLFLQTQLGLNQVVVFIIGVVAAILLLTLFYVHSRKLKS
jgi:prolipoprotein diacylglyceryl transferase